MKTKVLLMAVTIIVGSIKLAWGQQTNPFDVSYLSKVSLKQRISEESYLFNYPTGYEQTVNKYQLYNKKITKKYYEKGLENISKPQKALKYFMKAVEYGNRDASYQVGHYYCFGVFDVKWSISREGLKPIDAKKGLSYLNYASPNKLRSLFSDKSSWMFDPRRSVYCGILPDLHLPIYFTEPTDTKYGKKVVELLIKEYADKYDFNFERLFVDNFDILDGSKSSATGGESGWILYRIAQLAYFRDIIANHTNYSGGNDSEYKEYLCSQYLLLGFDYLNKKDEARALFNFTKAGYAGNTDGFRMAASMITDHCAKRFNYKVNHAHELHAAKTLYNMFEAFKIPEESGFFPEYQVLLEEAKSKYDEAYKRWRNNLYAEKEAKKEKRARFWDAFSQAVAAGAAATVQGMAMAAQNQNYAPIYIPTATVSTGFSTDYYTSPAYLNQVQMRANQSMANYQAQQKRIGQQALANNQQMLNRSKVMFEDMTGWAIRFQGDNGREPTELEKSQWVKQNYPDMYASYIQAQAAQYEQKSDSENSEKGDIHNNVPVSNTYDCSYCGGSGRLLQEEETLNFGLATEKEYKCKECGKWKYKGKTHRHYDCTHCKGKGKVTFN